MALSEKGRNKKMEGSDVVVDPQRNITSPQYQDKIEDEIEGHRKHTYVGIHMPKPAKRHHHRKRHKKQYDEANSDSDATTDTPLLERAPSAVPAATGNSDHIPT
ncbi:uncharacterized protein [Amphiura filiformis]|uniref:uncharacterized protein n=1 Tax=Amphiura filiformis TaxID=82378 RepID=UPI003B226215